MFTGGMESLAVRSAGGDSMRMTRIGRINADEIRAYLFNPRHPHAIPICPHNTNTLA
jgi:hypothetical protein